MLVRSTPLLAVVFLCSLPGISADEWTPEQVEFFERRVRPMLVESCQSCHGGEKTEGGVSVASRRNLVEGDEAGPLVDLKHPEKSLLLEVMRYDGFVQMPPAGKLPDESIAVLDQWIRMGAPWPASAEPDTDLYGGASPASPEGIAEARESHWSLQPVRDPPLPEVAASDWPQTSIDRWILADLEAASIEPAPMADRRTLARRVAIDLHGLPPTPEVLVELENDPRPTEQVLADYVDRLLADPAYGERWGRHWLDVARYADTKGYVFQEERRYPYAFTYRDYVIQSFNNDKPFDRFIVEQLAADQLDLGDDPAPLAAMGFLTLGRRFLNNVHDVIDDRIDLVGRGLLGLTISCSRCHDHKFDPIPTSDYYALYGVFLSSEEPAELPLIAPPNDSPATQAYNRQLVKLEQAVEDYRDELYREKQAAVRRNVGAYLLAVAEWPAAEQAGGNLREFSQERKLLQRSIERFTRRLDKPEIRRDSIFGPWARLAGLPSEEFAARAAEEVAAIAERKRYHPRIRAALAEPPGSLAEVAERYTQVFAEIEDAWQAALAEGTPEALPDAEAEALRQALHAENSPAHIRRDEIDSLLGRDERNKLRNLRVQVDRHKASPQAPPRAMVLVDRPQPVQPVIFRRGNPGNRGDSVDRRFLTVLDEQPTPFAQGSGRLELAQRIASPDNPLTARVIVNRVWAWHFGTGLVPTPSDFGTQGEPPTHPELLDHLAWHFMQNGWSLKWLHREILASRVYQQSSDLRPEALAVDPENRLWWRYPRQRLDFEAMRDSMLAVSGTLDRTLGGRPVELTSSPAPKRRTVYGFIDRQNLPGVFRTFDLASPDSSSPGRYVTTVPQQSLYLMNSPFAVEMARALAERAEFTALDDPEARIRAMYRRVYLREPDRDELALALAYVAASSESPAAIEAPRWQYGYGRYDAESDRVGQFDLLPYFGQGRWSGSEALPDPKLSWSLLNAQGGHPGPGPERMVMRRLTLPESGRVTIQGILKHGQNEGDGVEGRIVSSRAGTWGHYPVYNGEASTDVSEMEVEAGETIDFVVYAGKSANHDSFQWAPVVTLTTPDGSQRFDAAADFGGSAQPNTAFDRWARLAQVLLMSNEFLTVD